MAQSSTKFRVQSGIPWWLWLLMLVVGGGVLVATIRSLIPIDPQQHYQQGLAAFDQGDRESLAAAVEQLQKFPEYSGQLKLLQGLDLMLTARPLKAIGLLEEAVQHDAVAARARIYLGQALARGEQRLKAIEVLREAARQFPDDPAAHLALGGILHDLGAFDESLQELQLALDTSEKEGSGAAAAPGLSPEDQRKLRNSRRATAHSLRGSILAEMGRPQVAAVEFDAALSANPVNPENAVIALKLVHALTASGEFERALKSVDALDPGVTQEGERANVLLGLGKVDEARKVIDAALNNLSVEPFLHKINAKVRARLDRPNAEKVLDSLRTAISALTRDAEYFEAIAQVAQLAEQAEEAAVYAQNATQLRELEQQYRQQVEQTAKNVQDVAGRIAAGDLAAEIGKYEQARFWYSAAQKTDPLALEQVGPKLQSLYALRPELVSTAAFRALAAPQEIQNPGGIKSVPPLPESNPQVTPPGAAPAPDKPSEDKPSEDKPSEEKPSEEKPAAADAATETPA